MAHWTRHLVLEFTDDVAADLEEANWMHGVELLIDKRTLVIAPRCDSCRTCLRAQHLGRNRIDSVTGWTWVVDFDRLGTFDPNGDVDLVARFGYTIVTGDLEDGMLTVELPPSYELNWPAPHTNLAHHEWVDIAERKLAALRRDGCKSWPTTLPDHVRGFVAEARRNLDAN